MKIVYHFKISFTTPVYYGVFKFKIKFEDLFTSVILF